MVAIIAAAATIFLATTASSGQTPPPAPLLCSTGSDGELFVVTGAGELVDPRSSVTIWKEPPVVPTSLTCAEGIIALGVHDPREDARGKIVLFEKVEGSWRRAGEIPVRGSPRRLALDGGRIAAATESRGAWNLVMMDARPSAKGIVAPLAGPPSGLVVSPDRQSFLVSDGNDLRSFLLADGRTRRVHHFSEVIGPLATSPMVPWVLVGQGNSLKAVNLADPPDRGVLPDRASTTLPGTPAALAWLSGGRLAVAIVTFPPRLLAFDGSDLEPIEDRSFRSTAIVATGERSIASLAPGGMGEVREITFEERTLAQAGRPDPSVLSPVKPALPPTSEGSVVPPVLGAPPSSEGSVVPPVLGSAPTSAGGITSAPARGSVASPPSGPMPIPSAGAVTPPPAAPAPPSPVPASPPPAPQSAGGSPPAEPGSTSPAPVGSTPAPPAGPAPLPPGETVPPPAGSAPPTGTVPGPPTGASPPAAGGAAASQPKSEPATATKTDPGATPKTDPGVPSGGEPAERSKADPAAQPSAEPPPAASSQPPPAPGEARESTPGDEPSAPPTPPGEAADSASAPREAIEGGSIVGRLEGRAELVEELVLLGPDSGVRQHARIKPEGEGGAREYRAAGLPPGAYFVQPMGPRGASLACSPPIRRVVVTGAAGVRADFSIIGAQQ